MDAAESDFREGLQIARAAESSRHMPWTSIVGECCFRLSCGAHDLTTQRVFALAAAIV
jgi:hypothetical protein